MIWKFELEHIGISPKIEIEEPIGWDSVNFSIVRDMKNYGLSFEFSETLQFYKEARAYIYEAFANYNVDANVEFTAYYKPTQNTQNYTLFYKGLLVLRELSINNTTAKCRIEKNDFIRKFRNTIDLDCTIGANKDVKLHSKVIQKKAVLKVDATFNKYGFTNIVANQNLITCHTLLFDTFNELKNINNLSSVLVQGNYSNSVPASLFDAKEKGVTNWTGRLKGRVKCISNNRTFNIRFVFVSHYPNYISGNAIVLWNSGLLATSNVNQLLNIEFDFNINDFNIFNEGDSFWSFFRVIINNTNAGAGQADVQIEFEFDSESFLEFKQNTLSLPSLCQGASPLHALNQTLIENQLLGSVVSDFLSSIENWFLVTNGFKIREINEKNIKSNFLLLYESLRNIFNLGMSVENNVIRIEPFAYWFEEDELLVIDNPNEILLNIAQEFYFNKLLFGYKKWNNSANGQMNGLDEFNSNRQYSTQINFSNFNDENKNRKELNILNEAITAGYLIEYQRRLGKGSIDGGFDNDIFFIALNRKTITSNKYNRQFINETYAQGEVSERNESFFSVQNIISNDTEYNLRYSPIRTLLNWVSYIKTQLNKGIDNFKLLSFRSGEGNTQLNTCANTNEGMETICISESGIVDVTTDLDTFESVIDAEYVEFEYPLDFLTFEQIRTNFRKYITLNQGNYQFKGYIAKLDFNINKGIGKFKLIKKIPKIYTWGNGVKFNGVNQYLQTPIIRSISSNGYKDGEFSINMILKFENENDIFCWQNYFQNNGHTRIDIYSNICIFYALVFEVTRFFYFPFELEFSKTYIFSFVKKSGLTANDIEVYINGKLCQQGNIVNNNASNSQYNQSSSQISAISGVNQFYKNKLFDFKIFNKALNRNEIMELYNKKGSVIPQTAQNNVVLDLRFEEKTGFICRDSSGNNNNATAQNYTFAQMQLGLNNHRIDSDGNPILI